MNSGRVNLIIDALKGKEGTAFQLWINEILSEYWDYNNRRFESVSWYGGDQKNDGWLPEFGIFYQVYAPVHVSNNKKELQKKFSNDLERLVKKVIIERKWKEKLNEFIFVYNDRDLGLPEDCNSFFDKEVRRVMQEYKINFTHNIFKIAEIFKLLYEIKDTTNIIRLVTRLHLDQNYEVATATSLDIVNFLDIVANNIGKAFINEFTGDFSRISTDKKIEINKLIKHSDDIKNKLSKLTVVDGAVTEINSSIEEKEKFDTVKQYIITCYKQLSAKFSGDDLYDAMLRAIYDITGNHGAFSRAGELTLLYIFDRCDIFEKE